MDAFPSPTDPTIAVFVAGLDEDEREFFEERAGVIQYDGGLTRVKAEAVAYQLTLAYRERKRHAAIETDPSD